MNIPSMMTGLIKRNVLIPLLTGIIILVVLILLGPSMCQDNQSPPTPDSTVDTLYVPGLRDTIIKEVAGEKTFVERIRTVELPPDTVYLSRADTILKVDSLNPRWGMLEVEKQGERVRISSIEFGGRGSEIKRYTLASEESDFTATAGPTGSRVEIGRLDSWGIQLGATAGLRVGLYGNDPIGQAHFDGPVSLRKGDLRVFPTVIGNTEAQYSVGVGLKYDFFGGL